MNGLDQRFATFKVEQESRLQLLQTQVNTLQSAMSEAVSDNLELQDRLSDSIVKLQDVYFDLLKKNDGLVKVWDKPGKWAYLSFDDGPTEYTRMILDTLKKEKVRASFFVNYRAGSEALYRRIDTEGHLLGNHTYGHDYGKIYVSVKEFLADVDKLDAYLGTMKLKPTKAYRFPGGAKNEFALRLGGPDMTARISAALADRDYRFFEWNVAVGDGESKPSGLMYSASEITKSVISQARGKRIAVILLHDGPGHKASAAALPGIIKELKKLGFQFDVLP